MRPVLEGWFVAAATAMALLAAPTQALAQQRCDIPREARDIWHCENGFVIGPENVIIRLPIPETDPEALYNAGVEAAQREDWRVAIAYFTAAHQRAHLVPRYMYNLGLAHARAGHEVAAIAWLTTFLMVEPDAPNRSAVWAQITEMESAANRKIERLRASAAAATNLIPAIAGNTDQGCFAAKRDIATSVARAGDVLAATEFLQRAFESNCGPPPFLTLEQVAASWVLAEAADAAIADGDRGGAEELARQLPTDWMNAERTERLRSPQFGVRAFLGGEGSADLGWPGPYSSGNVLTALRHSNAAAARAVSDWDPTLSLAGSGRGAEALDQLSVSQNDGFLGNLRETTAARIAEIALFQRDLNLARVAAQRSTAFAEQAAARYRREGHDPHLAGWEATRINALLSLENVPPSQVIERLQVFVVSRGYRYYPIWVPNKTLVASSHWTFVSRFYAAGAVAEYLVWRNRIDDALAVAEDLDSMRHLALLGTITQRVATGQARFEAARISTLSDALLSAAGGASLGPELRSAIDDAVATARTLGGAAYDLDAVVEQVQTSDAPNLQATVLIGAAEDLARGLRRTHVAYQRSGRVWGQ